MTPTVIQRLREALATRGKPRMEAAIAAVEQELAAKDAEIAELRKRPTLDEAHAEFGRFSWGPFDPHRTLASLYAQCSEKARAEAPK